MGKHKAARSWLIFTAWSFSLEYMDTRSQPRPIIQTGTPVQSPAPILNFFAMPVAVAGATRLTTPTENKRPSIN